MEQAAAFSKQYSIETPALYMAEQVKERARQSFSLACPELSLSLSFCACSMFVEGPFLTMHVGVGWAGQGQLGAARQMGEAAAAWGEYEFSFAQVWHVQQQLVVVLVSRAHT